MSRYDEHLEEWPKTEAFRAKGKILPYRGPNVHELTLRAEPSRIYAVYADGVLLGRVTSNNEGLALIDRELVQGDVELKLVDVQTERTFRRWVTIRVTATFALALATVLEDRLDAETDAIRDARALDTVTNAYIARVYGSFIRQEESMSFGLEEYRNVLRALWPLYRHFAGTNYALEGAPRAVFGVSPILVPSSWIPAWSPSDTFFVPLLTTRASAALDIDGRTPIAGVDLPSLNARSLTAIHGAHSAAGGVTIPPPFGQPSTLAHALVFAGDDYDFPGPFTAPSNPSPLDVSFEAGWDGGDVTVIGLSPEGGVLNIVYPSTPGGTVPGTLTFASITSARHSRLGIGGGAVALRYPEPEELSVTFSAGWDGGDLEVDILDPNGLPATEVFLSAPGTTVGGETLARAVLGASIDGGTVGTASIGGRRSRFLRLLALADDVPPGTHALAYLQSPDRLTWRAGPSVAIPSDGIYTLRGPSRSAFLLGAIAGPFNTQALNVLRLNLDGLGQIDVRLTEAAAHPTATAAININDALNDDPRYGVPYAGVASEVDGAIAIESLLTGEASRIEIYPNPADASLALFGLPRWRGALDVGEVAGATVLRLAADSPFGRAPFSVRVGRGQRDTGTGSNPGAAAVESDVDLTGYVHEPENVGGFVRITGSASADNNGLHTVVGGSAGTSTVRLLNANAFEGSAFVPGSEATTWTFFGMGEVVNVTGVDGDELELEGTLALDHAAGALVELAEALPFSLAGEEDVDEVEVEIDRRFIPAAPVSDNVVVAGASVPDGWLVTGAPVSAVLRPGAFAARRFVLRVASGVAPSLWTSRPVDVREGLVLRFSAWVSVGAAAARSVRLDFSPDGGTTWTLGTAISVAPTPSDDPGALADAVGALWPTRIAEDFEVPWDASELAFRISFLSTTNGDLLFLEDASVVTIAGGEAINGSVLGNMAPESTHDLHFRSLLYAFAYERKTEAERAALGLPIEPLPLPPVPGHIDFLAPAHATVHRYDVTSYGAGAAAVPTNLFGAYDDATWALATLINLEVTDGSPPHATWARLLVTSFIEREAIEMFAPSNALIASPVGTDHLGPFPEDPSENDALYELTSDGRFLPLPSTGTPIPWRWVSDNELEIDASFFNSASLYEVSYQVPISAETAVLDLGASFRDFVWLTDLAAYVRHEIDKEEFTETEELTFLGDYTADLSSYSIRNKMTAVLLKNAGGTEEKVPAGLWSFLSPTRIQISASVFDSSALFTLTYTAVRGEPRQVPTLRLYWRAAAAAVDVAAEDYVLVEPNQVIDRTLRYHQLRVTISDVTDARDVQIHGFGLKGVRLYGGTPVAPGIVVPIV